MKQRKDKHYEVTFANIGLGICKEQHLRYVSTRKFGCMSRAISEETAKLYFHLCKEGKVPVTLKPTNNKC